MCCRRLTRFLLPPCSSGASLGASAQLQRQTLARHTEAPLESPERKEPYKLVLIPHVKIRSKTRAWKQRRFDSRDPRGRQRPDFQEFSLRTHCLPCHALRTHPPALRAPISPSTAACAVFSHSSSKVWVWGGLFFFF